MPDGIVLEPGGGRHLALGPADIDVKVTGEETRGALTFIEVTGPPGFPGPPPHVHRAHDELFFVTEGEWEFRVGDRTFRAGPGMFAFVPRGVPHAFSNPGDSPAKLVGTFSPPGYERYFEELVAAAPAGGGMPHPTVIYEIMARYQTEPAPPS